LKNANFSCLNRDRVMSFDFSFRPSAGQRRSEPPFRIAVLGDFAGQTNGPKTSLSSSRLVDCDNFDEVMAQIGVELDAPPSEEYPWALKLQFRSLEDFHPDQLVNRLEPLLKLTELRASLLHPATAEAAAKELKEILKIDALPAESPPKSSVESTEEMLGRLLGKRPTEPSRTTSPSELANRLIQQIVGSNVPSADPQRSQLAALADAELSARLRAILHHPDFQALEATWRGLDFLARNVTEEVKLSLIDIRASELATMLSVEDLAKSAIYRQLEKIRPAVVLGVYTFGPEDQGLLGKIAVLADTSHTALVAGASPGLVGCTSFGTQPDPSDWSEGPPEELEEFSALRRMPEAVHLGLALPRFLLRQPYGKGSDTIEAFPFEEMPAEPGHESYLWGNPAFLCGHLLAELFAAQGSELEVDGAGGEVGGLPIHTFTSAGETQVKPCAEAWLNERAANAILQRGIMPVLSVRGRDAVQLLTLRAISDPPMPLAVGTEFAE
jgi:type VI secretion system protein ImpC